MNAIALVVAFGLVLMLVERVAPARPLPRVPGWWPRAIALNGAQVLAVVGLGALWDGWLGTRSLLDLGELGALGGGAVAYLLATVVYYFWHRARHEVDFLWRWCHRLHHAPARLEVVTAFHKHPLEAALNALLSSLLAYGLLGLSPAAGGVYAALAAGAEFFYHLNVRTPRWVGWFVQRPEMHRLHHARGVHRWNYADLPCIDALFGTYRNPEDQPDPCGLGPAAEASLWGLLLARDLPEESAPPAPHPAAVPAGLPAPPAPSTSDRERDPAGATTAGSRRRAARSRTRVAGLVAPLLGALALAQMVGDLAGIPALRWIGFVSAASPAPKVFTDVDGFETFAAEFVLVVRRRDGSEVRIPLDPAAGARLAGPYPRRNVYGAGLAFAPRLPEPLLEQVLDHALLAPGDVARELGLPSDLVAARLEITSATRGRAQRFAWTRTAP